MLRICAAVLLTALALAGARAQPADAPLKLGLLLDMSGPYADISGPGSVAAVKLAVEDFGGKVLGRPIEVVFADHLNKPDIASTRAREWFDTQGVEAIMDVATSGPALAVNELAKARGKIVMFSLPGAMRLTNEDCGPYSIHWAYDTHALTQGLGLATIKAGYDSWFFITTDLAFGHDLEAGMSAAVKSHGGKVLGALRHPLNTPDLSSLLLQAQASKAKAIGLANAGNDAVNSIKQAQEFGITKNQKLAALLMFISDVHTLGLPAAQGLLLNAAFYWDSDDDTRAFAKRFYDRIGRMPGMGQAGAYSSTLHYLKAVAAAGTTDAAKVMKVMRETPVNDMFAKGGRIREDGRMVHDMYLFEVKKPSESKGPWDLYKRVATIPGDQAFQPH